MARRACYVPAVRGKLAVAILAAALGACAPAIDGPAERQRGEDRGDGDRLAAELAALPGVVDARVVLHRPSLDPLAPAGAVAAQPGPGAAILILTDDRADRAAIRDHARALTAATAPDVPPPAVALVVEAAVHRPVVAEVGPFTVEEGSRGRLRATLIALLGTILALAGFIAVRERGRP
jgi:hypothetical protein